MSVLGRLEIILGVNTAALEAAATKVAVFNKKIARAQARMQKLGRQFKATGRMMTTYLSLPMAAVGAAAVKLQMDFEASMAKVVGLVGIARNTVRMWAEDVKKLAPQVARAPEELADALYFITSAGVRGSEAMDVLEESAKAAAAGMGETKLIADLVTSAMNAYGKETLSAAEATDILAETVKEGKSEATLLASTMGMVLPIAAALGVTFDQVGAAGAAMTRTGTVSATAFMQLRQILNSLLDPAMMAEQAMQAMGTSSAELRDTIRSKGLLQALMDIDKLTKTYGENIMGKVFPNIRALSGTLDILGKNLESNITIFDNLAHATGRNESAFQAAAETTKFKFAQAVTTLKVALIELGESMKSVILPMFEAFSERIRKMSMWWKSLAAHVQVNILKLAGIVLVLGPVVTIFGFLIANILPALITLFQGLGIAVIAVGGALSALGLAEIIAIAAVVVLVVTKLVKSFGEAGRAAIAAKKQIREFNKVIEETNKIAKESDALIARAEAAEKLSKQQVRQAQNTARTLVKIEKENVENILKERQKLINLAQTGAMVAYVPTATIGDQKKKEFNAREIPAFDYKLNKQIEELGKAAEESKKRVDKLVEGLEDLLQAESNLMNPTEELEQATLNVIGPKNYLVLALEAEAQGYMALGQQYRGYLALQKELIRTGKTKKKYGTPDILAINDARTAFDQAIKRIQNMADKGVVNFDVLEETASEYEKIVESFLNQNVLLSDVEIFEFNPSPETFEMLKGIRSELLELIKTNNIVQAQLKYQKGVQEATDALNEYRMELSLIDAKKQLFPSFDSHGATISAIEQTVDALEELRRKKTITSTQLNDLDDLTKKLVSMKTGIGFVIGTMDALRRELAAIDTEAAMTGNTFKATDDKVRLIADAFVLLSTSLTDIHIDGLIGPLHMLNMLFGQNAMWIQSLIAYYKELGGVIDKLGTVSANFDQTYDGVVKALDRIDAIDSFFKVDKIQGEFSTIKKELQKLGIEFSTFEMKTEILRGAIQYAFSNFDAKGAEAYIKDVMLLLDGIEQTGIEKLKKISEIATHLLQQAASFASAMGNLIEAQKQRELSAVGDNAKKREAIEKEYLEKQKKWAIVSATISMFVGIAKSIELGFPLMIVGMALAAAAGVAQIAAISAQSYATGGEVKDSVKLPQKTRQGDDQLAFVKTGEVILNNAQQAYFGGPAAFAAAGVPEFATGAIVYGETLAKVGEYPGASSNPEIIAPLDKLASILRTEMMGGVLPDNPKLEIILPKTPQATDGLKEVITSISSVLSSITNISSMVEKSFEMVSSVTEKSSIIDKGEVRYRGKEPRAIENKVYSGVEVSDKKDRKVVFKIHKDELLGLLENSNDEYIHM